MADGRYLPGTRSVPVAPLQQLNLKLPPAVLDHWRAQALAEGVSVRDWLVSRLGPAAAAPAADLAERVGELERIAWVVLVLLRGGSSSPDSSPAPALKTNGAVAQRLRVALFALGQLLAGTQQLLPIAEFPQIQSDCRSRQIGIFQLR